MTLLKVLQEISIDACGADAVLVEKVLSDASHQQNSLIGALLESQLVDEEVFLRQISERFGYDWADLLPIEIPDLVRDLVPPRIALRFHFVPIRQNAAEIVLATYDPFQMMGVQAVTSYLNRPVRWVLTTRRSLLQTLKSCYGVGADTFEELLEGRDGSEGSGDLEEEVNIVDSEDAEASVIRFVNQIIREALNQKATDIHVEPLENDLRIRYRIDGVLHEAPVPQRIKLLQSSVISRLKIMAHLDIAEKRLPQDGRINLEFGGQPIDVRVATIPTVSGESVSLRLLGQERFDLQRLNLAPDAEENIRGLLKMSNGIILLTGPTGCGKSTTLYTFLSLLNVKERRIITIEDPVENKLEGVMQIAIKPEINLSFATALRSILRSDPNVIMVGEMRDLETAEIAIRAALTGHLVFSTLHTNDAVGGITRLIDMGIEPFLVSSSVRAFIAQRLVRRLCPHCKAPVQMEEDQLKEIGYPLEYKNQTWKAVGCVKCRETGYQGRMAIMEICMLSPQMQHAITSQKNANELRQTALDQGMVALREDGWRRVSEGLTTIDEVLRVTTTHMQVLDE